MKKEESIKAQEEYVAKIKRMEALNRLAFNILDRDGDNKLSILDLNWLRNNFSSTDTPLGKEIAEVFEFFMDKNVRPKYVKFETIIDFGAYFGLAPNVTLIDDLIYTFHTKLTKTLQ